MLVIYLYYDNICTYTSTSVQLTTQILEAGYEANRAKRETSGRSMLTPKATGIRAFTQNKGDLSHPSTPVAQVPVRIKAPQLTPKAPPPTPVLIAPDLTQPSVPTPARHGSAMTTASGVSEFQDRIKLAYNKIIEEDSDEEGDDEGDEDSDRDDISVMIKRAAFNNPTVAYPSPSSTQSSQPATPTSEKTRPSRNYKNRLTKNTKYNLDDIFIDDRSVNSLPSNEHLTSIPTSQTTTQKQPSVPLYNLTPLLQKSTPLLQKSTPNLYDLDALDGDDDDDGADEGEEGESDDQKELRLIKLYHRQFKILSNLGDFNGAEELLDKAIQLVRYMCLLYVNVYMQVYVLILYIMC